MQSNTQDQLKVLSEVHDHLYSANALLGTPGLPLAVIDIQKKVLETLNEITAVQNILSAARPAANVP
jgi:hypothetical protein